MAVRDFFAAVGFVFCGDVLSIIAAKIAARLAGKKFLIAIVDRERFHFIHNRGKESGNG